MLWKDNRTTIIWGARTQQRLLCFSLLLLACSTASCGTSAHCRAPAQVLHQLVQPGHAHLVISLVTALSPRSSGDSGLTSQGNLLSACLCLSFRLQFLPTPMPQISFPLPGISGLGFLPSLNLMPVLQYFERMMMHFLDSTP